MLTWLRSIRRWWSQRGFLVVGAGQRVTLNAGHYTGVWVQGGGHVKVCGNVGIDHLIVEEGTVDLRDVPDYHGQPVYRACGIQPSVN